MTNRSLRAFSRMLLLILGASALGACCFHDHHGGCCIRPVHVCR